MTHTDEHDQDDALPLDPEVERCHRYEITTAMNAVVRTCRDIVNKHSYRGFWTPTGDDPGCIVLAKQARSAVLAHLCTVLNCSDTVLSNVEDAHHERHRSNE